MNLQILITSTELRIERYVSATNNYPLPTQKKIEQAASELDWAGSVLAVNTLSIWESVKLRKKNDYTFS